MSGKPEWMPEAVWDWIRNRVAERGPVPKVDRIFDQGRSYHECALRCLELRDGQGFLFQQSVVLFAFAVELYLKGLLAIETKDTRTGGHDLSKVFEGLDTNIREQIAARYAERHGGQDLAADLQVYSKLFVEVRYAFEIEGQHEVDITGIAQLASAIYETWTDLRPDLLKLGIVHDRITAKDQGGPIVS